MKNHDTGVQHVWIQNKLLKNKYFMKIVSKIQAIRNNHLIQR